MKSKTWNGILISLTLFFVIVLSLASCSKKEIDTSVKPGNEGFVLGNGSIGVVLTHGLGASPYEVKGLAEYLAARNLTVYVVRLPGHGTSLEDVDGTIWEDWYKSYHEAYLSIKPLKQKVFVGGMSLGGSLALKLAEDEKVDGIISLAPALIMDDSRTKYAWVFKYFSKYSNRNISKEELPYYYPKFSIKTVAEMMSLSDVVVRDLNKINQPLFLMQYNKDHRVSPESSRLVYDEVTSQKKEMVWLNGTGHVMLLNNDKETAFEKIYVFIKSNS